MKVLQVKWVVGDGEDLDGQREKLQGEHPALTKILTRESAWLDVLGNVLVRQGEAMLVNFPGLSVTQYNRG